MKITEPEGKLKYFTAIREVNIVCKELQASNHFIQADYDKGVQDCKLIIEAGNEVVVSNINSKLVVESKI